MTLNELILELESIRDINNAGELIVHSVTQPNYPLRGIIEEVGFNFEGESIILGSTQTSYATEDDTNCINW